MTQQSYSWAYTLTKIIKQKDPCPPVFIGVLFKIARMCKPINSGMNKEDVVLIVSEILLTH